MEFSVVGSTINLQIHRAILKRYLKFMFLTLGINRVSCSVNSSIHFPLQMTSETSVYTDVKFTIYFHFYTAVFCLSLNCLCFFLQDQ